MAPSSRFTAAGLLAVAGVASAFYIPEFAGVVGPGFVSIPLSAPKNTVGLRKRDGPDRTATLEIPNLKTSGYTIKIAIGSPPQELVVAVDTGSSELWINPDCSRSSRARNMTGTDGTPVMVVDSELTDPAECRKRGRYDQEKSSTAETSKLKGQTIQYGDFTTVEIGYVADTITIGGLTISDQVFGVATKSNQTGIGIMGFGPSHYGFNYTKPYPLILQSMAEQGVINSPVFSLNLGDYDADAGSLTFGGVDTKRYTGKLATVPFEKFNRKLQDGSEFEDTSYYVTVKSMTLQRPDGSTKTYAEQAFPVSLDCGAGANILPDGMATEICADVNGTMITTDTCEVPCRNRQKPGGITFALNGQDITVPYKNLINEQEHEGQEPICILMMSESAHITPGILGAPFLRSAYTVYDWGNGNLHLAQAADCGSNIVAVGTGANAVPSGDGECGQEGGGQGGGGGNKDEEDKKNDGLMVTANWALVRLGSVAAGFIALV
ncbi:Aspartic peptidase domain containing protein [Rhypophila decipiens]